MNPLSFSIGVKDEASEQLGKINAELNNLVSKLDSIKNIAISLGGDPGEAESLMKSLNGVAASLANISRLSPEAQAASDRLTDSQQKLNAAMEQYNNLLAKIKAANPMETFLDATKNGLGANFDRIKATGFGSLDKLDPTMWAEHLKKFLDPSIAEKDIESNIRQLIVNIRNIMARALHSDLGTILDPQKVFQGFSLAPMLEESFKFDSINQKLNEAFAKLREEYIKGVNQLKDVQTSQNGLGAIEGVLPGLKGNLEAAQKEFEALKNATSSTPVNPEAFKGAESAIAATNEATKLLGEALNKLDFTKINTALDQLAERLNKLVTELAGIEERMKTAFTGALEANVTSLGNVIDGLAKKMAAMSTPMSEGMKQGEQATNAQTEAIKKQEDALVSIQKKLQRVQEIREQAVSTISELRSSYGSKPNRDWWANDTVRDAIAKDRAEEKRVIDELDKKWETYWRKQEQEAQKFANSLGKALKDVKWDDFEKHSSGALSDQAKSWYRVQMRELYDVQRMKEEVHRLKGYGDDQYREEIRVLEALIRKISQYENAKAKAFNSSTNQDAAVSKISADERAYYVAWGHLSAANEERRKLLAQEAEAQQRLNGLRSGDIDASAVKYEEQRLAITKQIEEAEKNIALAKERISKADAQLARLNSGQMSAKEAAAFVGQHAFEPGNYGAFIESEQKRITALKQQLAELDEQKRQSATTAEKQTQSEQQQAQATKELGQTAQQAAEQIQKLAQSTVAEAFKQLAESLTKIKELFDNLGKADGLNQLNNTINGVNTAVEALAKTLSNVNNAVKFTGSTEEIAAYEAKVKSLQEQVTALEAKAKGLGETAKVASEQVKTVTASGGGGSSKDGLTKAQLKKVNDQLEILQKRLNTIEPNHIKAKEFGFSDEVIQGKINHLHAYIDALNEAIKAGSYSGIKVGEYSLFSKAANEDIPTQAQAQKMAKQMQEYIAIQQQAEAEAERQAQAQERMRQAAEAAGMSIVKAGDQTQSAGQQSESAKQQMHGFNEEILVNMRSWEQAGKQMAIFEKRIFAVMAQLQSGKALGFDTGNLQNDIKELMRFYAIMREIRNNYGFAEIEGAMLTTSKVLKESGLDFGKMWEKNKQELTAVKTIYEQMVRLQALANNKNALPTDNLNTKYQREALENALRAQDIMAKLKSVDLRQATALVGGQDYQQATAAIEAFFRTYNKNANIATSQTAELQRLLEKIQGTDKGGGWINVMKNAGVSEDKINEMRQIAEKIQRAIAALEQSRQMGTAANFVQSDWYRATVIEGKKANDTGYLAVREAHERAAAEREASKATQESAKAAEKKREEMSKAWREQEAARQKEAAAIEASMQKQMAAEEKARQKSIEDAWKAADQKIKADQHAAQERERANQQATKEEIKGYEQAVKAEYAKERAMSKRFAAEQAAAKKAQQEKDKLYGTAGLRESDPGLQNMTAQLDALMQKIAKVRGDIEATRDFISRGNRGEQDFGLEQLRALEQEVNTLMRQYEALYQARAALSAQVPFAETQRIVKNVELEQLGEKYRQEAKAADEAAKAKKRDAENSMAAGKAISDLQLKIDKYNKSQTFQKAKGLHIDTSDYERAIERLERYKKLLEYIKSDAGKHHNPSLITGIGSSAENDIKRAEAALKQLVTEKQQAASATQQLTSEQQRLAQALTQTTEHARGQSQVLSDLKMMATQYLGVWGAQQFLHNIIEIGGQLEMQRMSIGAILQNQSQANDLFEKIKGLAIQSPFGVVELDQMTKQLTAYGFKYSELFDMTKRLADISAATGTGVDRLALALGHVRSEAALSGYTLRQFSMGNVPLLQKLSEKLGKTTAEIRKMVRTKEISYADVEGVIKDLTNEGGMFYNMQEVISQSVKARFKNVKDAMAIMYGEMAESGMGDALKGVADALMDITKNWKDVATVVGTGAAVWGVHRAAILAMNYTLGQNTSIVSANVLAYKKKRVAELQNEAMVRKLTAEEALMVSTRNSLTAANIRLALANNALTKGEVLKLIALRKVSIEEAKALVRSGELTAAEVRLALQGRILGFSLKKLGIDFEFAGFRFGKAGAALNLFTQRVRAAVTALLANPWTWTIAGLTAMVELWQRDVREMEKAQEVADGVYERSQNALENTRKMMQQTGITAYNEKRENITSSFGMEKTAYTFLPEFDPSTADQIMEEWSQYIRDYAATPNRLLNQSFLDSKDNVLSLKDAFDKLGESVKTVMGAQEELAKISDIFADAQLSTNGGWFDDDAATDLKDYENAYKQFNRQVAKTYSEFRKRIDGGIEAAREQDEAFKQATDGMSSYAEMYLFLAENADKYKNAIAISGLGSMMPSASGAKLAEKEAEKEVDTYITTLKAGLELAGINPAEMTPAQQQAALLGFKEFLSKAGVQTKKAIDYWIKYFTGKLGIEGEHATEKTVERLTDWQKRAQGVFSVNQTIKVKTKTITSLDEFAQAVQKDLKEKQEYITRNASHIRQTLTINAGVKFNLGKLDTKSLNDMIIKLGTRVQVLIAQGKVDAAQALSSVIQDELLPFRDALASIDENKKWLKQEGYPEKDPTKDKSKNKSKNDKAYKDPIAEEWKERIRLLKDANSLYKEWNKRSGEDASLSRVRQQYGDIFEKWRTDKNVPWKDFKAEDIIEYRKYVQKIVDEAQKRYDSQRNDKAKNYGKEAEAVLREGKKLLDDIDKYDFDEKAREFKVGFEKALDEMTRKWEIFTSVRNATGNKLLAFDMAKIGQESRNLRNAADAMKNKLADEMQRVGGNELLTKIPFSIDIDEEKLRDQFKAALGDSEKYATTIDGLVEAYKKWQKLQQDVVKSDIDVFAKLMGSVVSYSAQIRKINDELAQQKTAIANSGASASQQQEATAVAESQADWKKMKLSADYSNLYNKTIAMSRTEFERAADAVQNMIDKLRDLGTISPDEYLQEVEKLNKARMEWSTTGFLGERGAFGQFISGGNQGLMDYYQQRADAARRRADQLKDIELVPSAAQINARAEAEHYQKLYEALKKVTDEAQNVVTAFQTLQSGIDLLGGLFDSLGMEGAANAMSDAGGILGGALQGASSLSALGPYGMAAGAAIGLIGGIAQVHDKALERHINKLREDVKGIEANTELIAKARERTLGYDMGDVRRQMAQQYASQPAIGQSGIVALIAATLGNSKQKQSMYDYYANNSQGTGYQQEFDNLVEQREKYMEILKDQQSKKKKSNDEIEETKSKIAELDDQIRYFTQDLAKELWGIDIKGWADQLSDALASAFENGENMAKAYRDTVNGILQQMMQKMMQMSILEPMFKNLQEDLFGDGGSKKGVFDPNNPKGSMSKVTKLITDYFGNGGDGEKAITASMEFMTAFQRAMQNAGLSVLSEASNTLSSSMQGTTEETSGLLAGYVNALRQDVSANRILLNQFVSQMWPDYIETFASQVTAVQNIDSNVQVIMMMMQTGSGAMYEQIAALRSRIDNVVLGIDKFNIK